MHSRSVTSWLLGLWLGCSLFMVVVATRNFRAVDRLLEIPAPPAAPMIQTLGHRDARMLLRYLSSELNRWYFDAWEIAQLGLAPATAALVFFTPPRKRIAASLSLAMTVIVVMEHFALTPEIIRMGRLIDFAGPEVTVPERDVFWRYHHWYSGLEVTKMAMLAALTAMMLRRDPRDR